MGMKAGVARQGYDSPIDCCFGVDQTGSTGLKQQSVRKTHKYRLKPTPERERALERTLMRCRHIYNAAVGERREAWRLRRVSVTYYPQKAELPGIKEAMPDSAEVNAPALQDVVLRVDRAFQAFCRRVKAGETPGYPRFHGRERYNSYTFPQVGESGGAALDGGILSLSKVGRIPVRLHRPLEGTPKAVTISREADGWRVCLSCAAVPVRPLPPNGASHIARRGAIAVGKRSYC
jgi:putative transposase